jgi:MoaA/NifB/PqqE/SkfB family radical SAM enzyme
VLFASPLPAAASNDGDAQAPLRVCWEVTQACELAYRHCRLAAVRGRHLDELSTYEGFQLLEDLAGFGQQKPQLLLLGGDPLWRPDIYGLVARADELGLPVGIALCATPRLTQEALAHLYARGARSVILRLDGSIPTRHDAIRLVQGSFTRTLAAARWARELGMSVQIDTLACEETLEDLPDIFQQVLDLPAERWCLRFPVGGRGTRDASGGACGYGLGTIPAAALRELDAYRCEGLLEWLYELALEAPRPVIDAAEAHHFRRIALQHRQAAAHLAAPPRRPGWLAWHTLTIPWRRNRRAAVPDTAAGHRPAGMRDGAGTVFISHTGEVSSSEFLPLSAGNVRTHDPVRLYRGAPLFVQLRDPSLLQGTCGVCEYRGICGGSRARAWTTTADVLAQDPLCAYQPRAVAATGSRPAASEGTLGLA